MFNKINVYFIYRYIEVMNLRSLETLVEIAEQGSFIRSAERLNMTLSTVSMQMKVLEEELGVQLFDRTRRPPQLTPMGRRVAAEAVGVLSASARLQRACTRSDSLAGNFRIGFVLTSSIRLLPGFLARARVAAREAHFAVETGLSDELAGKVVAGTLDAAVVTGGDLPRTLDTRTLTREELVYCLPKAAANWSIADCMSEMPFIHFMAKTGIGRLIARHLEAAHLTPKTVIVLDSVEAVSECVRAGVGFSILPEPDIRRAAGDDVVLRSLLDQPVMRELVLAYQAGGPFSENAERLAVLFDDALAEKEMLNRSRQMVPEDENIK